MLLTSIYNGDRHKASGGLSPALSCTPLVGASIPKCCRSRLHRWISQQAHSGSILGRRRTRRGGWSLHTRTDVARGSPARASASLEPKTQPHRASSIPAPQRPAPSSADHRVQQALAHGLRESRAGDVSQRQWPTEEVGAIEGRSCTTFVAPQCATWSMPASQSA